MGIWGRRNRDDRYDFGEDDWDVDDVDDVGEVDEVDDSDDGGEDDHGYDDGPDDEEDDWTDDIDDGEEGDEDQYGDLLGEAYDPGQIDEDDYDRQYDRQHGGSDFGYDDSEDVDDGDSDGYSEDVDEEDWSENDEPRRSGRGESQHRSWLAPTVGLVAVLAVLLIGWRLLWPEDSGSEDSVAEPSRTQQSEEVERTRSQVTPTTTSAAPTTTEAPKIDTGATSGKKAAESFAEAYYVDRDPKRALYYFNPNGSTSEQEMAGEISALTGSDTKTSVSESGDNSFSLQVSGVFDGTRQNYDPMTLRVGEYRGKWFVMEITAGAGV